MFRVYNGALSGSKTVISLGPVAIPSADDCVVPSSLIIKPSAGCGVVSAGQVAGPTADERAVSAGNVTRTTAYCRIYLSGIIMVIPKIYIVLYISCQKHLIENMIFDRLWV